MRTIKFRAWNPQGKGMVENANHLVKFYNEDLAGDKVLLLQFTGLLDKNGKEIYEGDIVELAPLRKGDSICLCFIKYDGCSFELFGVDNQIKYVRELFVENLSGSVKVIGNIYENPELLEDRK